MTTKSKAAQKSDWEQRPLDTARLCYAAEDAAVLRDIVVRLMSQPPIADAVSALAHREPCSSTLPLRERTRLVHSSLAKRALGTAAAAAAAPAEWSKLSNRSEAIDDLTADSTSASSTAVELIALFLTPDSRARLLGAISPQPPSAWRLRGDHITLLFRPPPGARRKAALAFVGRCCAVRVHASAARTNERVFAARADFGDTDVGCGLASLCESGMPHVTIATAPHARPIEALGLWSAEDDGKDTSSNDWLELNGVVGLDVVETASQTASEGDAPGAELTLVSASVARRVRGFAESAQRGQVLRFLAHELTAVERRQLHLFAERNGLESRSEVCN